MAKASHSRELNAAQAVARVTDLDSREAVENFTAGDDRQAVREAAQEQLDLLGSDLGPPSPQATAAKPLETGGSGKATVRTRYPLDRFEHQIDGVPVITAQGVEVNRSDVAELLERATGVPGTVLEEVDG